MKRSITIVVTLALFSLALPAREHKDYVVHYDVSVREVTRETEGEMPQSLEVKNIASAEGIPSLNLCSDESLSMNWIVYDKSLEYVLQNKTDTPMTVLIHEVQYGDVEGKADSLGYSLFRPANDAYAVVESDSSFMGFLIPLQNYASSGFFYDAKPLIPNVFASEYKARRTAQKHVGEELTLLFPVHVGSLCHNYRITFTVTGIRFISERTEADVKKEQEREQALLAGLDGIAQEAEIARGTSTRKKPYGHKLTLPAMQELYKDLRIREDFFMDYIMSQPEN